jgi:hypothetical protein
MAVRGTMLGWTSFQKSFSFDVFTLAKPLFGDQVLLEHLLLTIATFNEVYLL